MFNDSRWEMRDYPRLFAASEAEALGITRHYLFRTQRCPIILPGVRMDRETLESRRTPRWADDRWEWDSLRLRAARMKFDQVLADHATAARIYGWPMPANFRTDPHLSLCTDDLALRVQLPNVTLRRSAQITAARWLDLPVLAPADVFISIAPDLTIRDLVKVGDAAVGRWHGPPQLTVDTLTDRVGQRKRLRARRRLRDAIDLIRPGVDSPTETDLRLWIVSVGLPEPTVHPKISSDLDRGDIEPDLGYENARLALEYEGDHHRSSPTQWARDIERDEAMRDAGWTVLKVTRRTDYRLLQAKIRRLLGLT